MASKQLSHFPTSQVPRWGTLLGYKEQVAVLRLHAASTSHVTDAAYSWTRNKYVLQSTKKAPELRRTPSMRSSHSGHSWKLALADVTTGCRSPHPPRGACS